MSADTNSVYTLQQWQQLERDVFGDRSDSAKTKADNEPSLFEVDDTATVRHQPGAWLTTMFDYARANYQPPVAYLLGCCVRTLSATPATVKIDAGLGATGLNQFMCLLGSPGAGKDNLMRHVDESLVITSGKRIYRPRLEGVGSGEGLITSIQGDEDAPNPSVLLSVSEVTQLAALAGRQGATTRQTLLQIYSGNDLYINNKQEKVRIPKDSYRAGLWIGAQPDTVGSLLVGDRDGFRERFVFTELLDPTRVAGADYVTNAPEKLLPVLLPADVVAGKPITFDAAITRKVVGAREARLIHGEEAGHKMLTTLKLSAALALLGGRGHVDVSDFNRATALMAYSDAVVAGCEEHLRVKKVNANADSMRAKEDARDAVALERELKPYRLILKALEDAGNERVSVSPLRQSLNSRYRGDFDRALIELEKWGALTVATNGNSVLTQAAGRFDNAVKHYGLS